MVGVVTLAVSVVTFEFVSIFEYVMLTVCKLIENSLFSG